MSDEDQEVYVGPTCLYKDGEAKRFEGAEVVAAARDGWRDTPQPAAPAPDPTAPLSGVQVAAEPNLETISDTPSAPSAPAPGMEKP